MKKKQTSNDIRARLCELVFNKDYDLKEAAIALGLKYKTAYSICKLFLTEFRSDKKKKMGRRKQFNSNVEAKIRGFFEANKDATLSKCKKFLDETREDETDKVPSLATISRILKKL